MIKGIKILFTAVILTAAPALPAKAWISNGSADMELGQGRLIAQGDTIFRATAVNHPCGVAVDSVKDRLYVADTEHNRVLWWNMNGFSEAGNGFPDGVLGQADFSSTEPNRGGAAAADTLKRPYGVAVDDAGNLWVADSLNHRVLRFSGELANGREADLILGQPDGSASAPNRGRKPAQNSLVCPRGIAIDRSGNIWVADYGNNRVLRFSSAHLRNGQNADLVFGQKDFVSAAYNRKLKKEVSPASCLASPSGVSVDRNGNVWVTDSGNSRVVRYRPGYMNGKEADLVLGRKDFKIIAGKSRKPATSGATLYFPNGIAADDYGVWIADEFNHRVLRYNKPYSSGMEASLVIGQFDFSANQQNRGSAASAITLARPTAVAADATGSLWAADASNNRVTCYRSDMKAVTAAEPPSLNGTLKEYYPDGRLKKRLQYRNGMLNGSVKEFFEDGRLKLENRYEDNSLEGLSHEFYENGILKSEVNFRAGQLDGPARQYDDRGILIAECFFKDGRAEGTAREYGADGQVRAEIDFIDGILIEVKEYDADGAPRTPEAVYEPSDE